jgi:hypothetical protein
MRVLFKRETLRRLTPAFVVGGVLLASLLTQAPSLASNNDVGYGYANNCGVKGDGMHDHGKTCPNRPFPGHGKGVMRILGTSAPSESVTVTTTETKGKVRPEASVTTTSAGDEDDSIGATNGHGHGHSRGHGNGRKNA